MQIGKKYMIKLSLSFAIICFVLMQTCYGQLKLGSNTVIVFATVDEGKQILTSHDDFVERLSPFDRAARMKTDRNVSQAEYLKFVGLNVLAWTENEKQNTESAFDAIRGRLEILSLSFPKTIYLVKTTGNEEGNAAYTRSNAVVFPINDLRRSKESIEKMLAHELFHILTRANPLLREQLYEAIGFSKCNEIEFPPSLLSRKITNPDAPVNDHYIRLQLDEKTVCAVPILFSSTEKYDVARGGEFFNYLQFQLLLVERSADTNTFKPLYNGPNPVLASMEKVRGFYEQVGNNTEYIIHPEEILADNFASIVLDEQNLPSPQIIRKIKDTLAKKLVVEPNTP
jgi:hypothetical protein